MLLAFLVYIVSNLAYNGTFFAIVGTFSILAFIIVKVFKFLYILLIDIGRFKVKENVEYKLKDGSGYITPTDVFEHAGSIYVGNKRYEYNEFIDMIETTPVSEHPVNKLQASRKWVYFGVFCLMLHTLLPNRDTMIYCASAYMVQTIITDDRTKELGSAAYDATLNQLQQWSKENKDVEKLIQPVIKKVLKNETN